MPASPFAIAHVVSAARAALLLCAMCSMPCAAADADSVNERIPVSRDALEKHWNVDCSALRQDLLAWSEEVAQACAAFSREAAQADISTRFSGLALCAAIYNPPGETRATACPDYAAAARALREPDAEHDPCSSKPVLKIRKALECAE